MTNMIFGGKKAAISGPHLLPLNLIRQEQPIGDTRLDSQGVLVKKENLKLMTFYAVLTLHYKQGAFLG